MTVLTPNSSKVTELRDAFDGAFADLPASTKDDQYETLLAIRTGNDLYAIKIGEITGLAVNRNIVPFPTPISGLLGIAGIRGELVPVYSLASLLGHSHDVEQPKWLALCGANDPVGLAFNGFEGHLRVPVTEIYAANQDDVKNAHHKQMVGTTGSVRVIVNVTGILEMIKERCARNRTLKEI